MKTSAEKPRDSLTNFHPKTPQINNSVKIRRSPAVALDAYSPQRE